MARRIQLSGDFEFMRVPGMGGADERSVATWADNGPVRLRSTDKQEIPVMRLDPTATRRYSIAVAVLMTACTYLPEGVQPVRGFDAARYMGTWHEVARLPNRFEEGLEQVTATYSLQSDGSVMVVNRGYDVARRQWRDITGRARFVGEPDVAALKVSFFGPFYGGYNVIDLDSEYRYALVAGPDRSYLWILSREPSPPSVVIERLKRKAAELGFDTRALVYVQHSR